MSAKIKAPDELKPLLITRAVHDVNNGHPLNPRNEKSWSQAALSLTAELVGNYIADADKSALDTSHAVFANIWIQVTRIQVTVQCTEWNFPHHWQGSPILLHQQEISWKHLPTQVPLVMMLPHS